MSFCSRFVLKATNSSLVEAFDPSEVPYGQKRPAENPFRDDACGGALADAA